ncbi:hypothetical protein [Nevskia ramosa]|uniref:hypothetical protein n=1 Tax=Nevskia ramosa TaxID=64002 RepID=UPI002355BC7D|nr:hypothetical protein [Nevskia ramosa]
MLNNSMTRDAVLSALAKHVGRENGVTAKALVIEIVGASCPGYERQLRQCVEQLRDEGIAVCADPAAGYHIARNAAELEMSIQFLVDRINTSARQVRALQKLARPGLTGQSRLLL